MLNEPSRRRPDFKPGVPLQLDDRQIWEIPVPRVVYRYGSPVPIRCVTLGRDFDAAVSAFVEATTQLDILQGSLLVAAAMLRANYDLTDLEISTLISIRPDGSNVAVWRAVREVIMTGLTQPDPPIDPRLVAHLDLSDYALREAMDRPIPREIRDAFHLSAPSTDRPAIGPATSALGSALIDLGSALTGLGDVLTSIGV